MRIRFFADRAQALWAVRRPERLTGAVAITAEAAQIFDEHGLPVRLAAALAGRRPVAAFLDQAFPRLLDILDAIETFVAARQPSAGYRPLGVLSANWHPCAYVLSAAAMRFHLLRAACVALGADRATLFAGRSEAGTPDPWLAPFASWCAANGVSLETLPAPEPEAGPAFPADTFEAAPLDIEVPAPAGEPVDLSGLRLLLIGSAGYDWEAPLEAMRATGDARAWLLPYRKAGPAPWRHRFDPYLLDLVGPRAGERLELAGGVAADTAEQARLGQACPFTTPICCPACSRTCAPSAPRPRPCSATRTPCSTRSCGASNPRPWA